MSRLEAISMATQQPYNMLGSNYVARRLKALILKGIDTLEFGLEVNDYLESFNTFLSKIKALKEISQITGIEQKITIGELNLTVHRNGQKFYAYRLSCSDFSIAFMDKTIHSNPPVFVRFMSSYLWSYGFVQAYQNFLNWFSIFKVNIQTNKLSRVDICVDTDEVNITKNDVNGVVTRARNKTEHFVNEEYTSGRVFSGFTVGGGKTLLARIYHKTLEIKKSGKVWFYEIWNNNGWNTEKNVWRIEFQIRRPILKELSLDTMEQLEKKTNELWAYLTHEWLSIRQPKKDNTSRWKIKRKWKIIQKAELDYKADPLIRNVIKQGNLKRLLDQASGLMMSVAAVSNHNSITETSDVIKSWFEVNLKFKQTTFEDEKDLRRNRFLSDSLDGI